MDKKEIKELGNAIMTLQREAVAQTLLIWKPEAERIIDTNSKDINAIEHTLDALCEVAFDDEILVLFKKLCRYYYDIDPQATAEQIQFYREMWDNNDEIESDG
ncbi:MAG: hypothetical protein DRJ01_14370 [Bacteroidetes bacterium]|nr:MAG: hypothetical protein DRJ01_14370 [Bacteroidota bacterium]